MTMPRFIHRVPRSIYCPTLYACSLCGALVLGGEDLNKHEEWHSPMVGDVKDDLTVSTGDREDSEG